MLNLKSLKVKIALIITACTTLIFAAVSWIIYNQSASILEEEIVSAATNNVHHNSQIIDNWLMGIKREVNIIADTTAVKSMDWEQQQAFLKREVKKDESYEAFLVADLDGNAYATSGEAVNVAGRQYFQEVKKSGSVVISDPIISKVSGDMVVAVAAPIYSEDNSALGGVLIATIKLNYLQELVKAMTISGSGYGVIINSDMTVIAHPDKKWVNSKKIWDESESLKELGIKAANGESGYGHYIYQGIEKEMAYAPLKLTNWAVLQTANTADVMAPLSKIKFLSLAFTLAAIAVMLLVAVIIANYISKPITLLSRTAEAVAEGDLAKKVNIGRNRDDEIGTLASSFQKMVENLKSIIADVKNTAETLASHSQEMASSSEEVSANIEEVASTTNEVAATSAQSTENAEKAAQESEQVQKVAEEGNKAVQEAVEKIHSIASSVKNVSATVYKLGKQSEEIGKIINTITGIAEQTNLLALNAAIEAARAGEHGRGFAVVAEEVRKLAEQSAAAAKEITNLINEIQIGVGEAVNAMDQGVNEVNEGVQIANKAGVSLEHIIEAVRKNTAMIHDIATGSKQANEGTQQLSAAGEQIASAIQQVSASAQEIANIAEELESAISKFKIEIAVSENNEQVNESND
ncbi:MAG: HAMP domain-containing protein [Desulfotomaculum sp.]|nr:HAMP domain-containing protein [Desulfotomaculum sp.]